MSSSLSLLSLWWWAIVSTLSLLAPRSSWWFGRRSLPTPRRPRRWRSTRCVRRCRGRAGAAAAGSLIGAARLFALAAAAAAVGNDAAITRLSCPRHDASKMIGDSYRPPLPVSAAVAFVAWPPLSSSLSLRFACLRAPLLSHGHGHSYSHCFSHERGHCDSTSHNRHYCRRGASLVLDVSSQPSPRDSDDAAAAAATPTTPTACRASGVTLKMAFDSSPLWSVADLSAATSQRFTSEESLDLVHRLRRESDCVLVGRATVERDDCSLTVRRVRPKVAHAPDRRAPMEVQPTRVVIDPALSLLRPSASSDGTRYALFNDGLPTIVYHCSQCDARSAAAAPRRPPRAAVCDNVVLVDLPPSSSSSSCARIAPADILSDLRKRSLCGHVMVEGGPATAMSFLTQRLVDRAIIIKAPVSFQHGIPVPSGMNESILTDVAGLVKIGTRMFGADVVQYWVRNGSGTLDNEQHANFNITDTSNTMHQWPTQSLADWP